MKINFKEEFSLPLREVFDYFKTPQDWVRLYGAFGTVEDRGDGWYAVPIKRFPFPLVARITALELDKLVHWTYRGFWQGEGEVRFALRNDRVIVEGYEEVSLRWLFTLSPIVEKLWIERRFRKVWRSGWHRLHKREMLA
jgi:hypothetical protein